MCALALLIMQEGKAQLQSVFLNYLLSSLAKLSFPDYNMAPCLIHCTTATEASFFCFSVCDLKLGKRISVDFLDNVMASFTSFISNGISKGINSKSIKPSFLNRYSVLRIERMNSKSDIPSWISLISNSRSRS